VESARRDAVALQLRRIVKASLIGLGVAGLGISLALSPWGADLEERAGLEALFRIRGPIEPPAEVAVVSLDRDSAERLDLPEQIRDWPRSIHARLIDRLVEAGVSVIVFDLILTRPQDPVEDRALATAIAGARRVVLFQYLDTVKRPITEAGEPAPRWLTTERVVAPLPAFAEGAMGLAPFPLPKVPGRVSQFWTFQHIAGESPTLPVVALQHHARPVYHQWLALLKEHLGDRLGAWPDDLAEVGDAQDWRHLIVTVRQAFRADPTLAARMGASLRARTAEVREQRLLHALIGVYGGGDSRYLNFYGPAGGVPTVSLHRILRSEAPARSQPVPDLSGRVVFVGQSELTSHAGDDFITAFSGPDAVDLSGVEIAATAFANLLDGRTLQPVCLGAELALLATFGILVGLIAGLAPGTVAVTLCLALAAACYAGAQIVFTRADLWLPVAVPLLVQLPLGLLAGLLDQYRDAQRARTRMSRGIRYYLPDEVATGLAEAPFDPTMLHHRVYATSMVTDAQGFTSLAETMSPEALKPFLDSYLAIVIGSVERFGGAVTDIVGDGTTCVWRSPVPARSCRVQACTAALEIGRAVAVFNARHAPLKLPTRMGLHAGWVVVGNIGGAGHFSFIVLGDTVNTTSRIEQLNKQLGTYVLASEAVVAELDEFLVRPLGRFQVIGKKEVLRLSELRGLADDAHDAHLLADFAQGLAWFEEQRWQEAARQFESVLSGHPDDGPARFYLERCRRYLSLATVPAGSAVIRLERK
jgi:adenylate cyclase